MPNSKTHFEEVPLEVVKRLVAIEEEKKQQVSEPEKSRPKVRNPHHQERAI
jgi:hypothetical protein